MKSSTSHSKTTSVTSHSLTSPSLTSLEAVLDQQLQAAQNLARVLDKESAAIKNRDAEALNDIAPLKLEGLETLETLEKARLAFASDDAQQKKTAQGSPNDPLWNQVIDVIRVCDRKNQLNGAMLALRQQHIQRAMDLITNRDAESVTYAPDGSTIVASGQQSTSLSA